jgi:hypothetical protein
MGLKATKIIILFSGLAAKNKKSWFASKKIGVNYKRNKKKNIFSCPDIQVRKQFSNWPASGLALSGRMGSQVAPGCTAKVVTGERRKDSKQPLGPGFFTIRRPGCQNK